MKLLLRIILAILPLMSMAQKWEMKQAPLMTSFSKDVNPESVLPEYPRPQMVREKWMNLNGVWQYQPGTWANEAFPQGKLSSIILVPFAVESALSGVKEHHDRLWYRREFTIPADWKGQKILLHFGAVDYETQVFVNNKSVGKHQGGYDPFVFDITPFIQKDSIKQNITIKVFDPTDGAGFPRGKQTLNPKGIMYTSVTGIWQTVWLEPVPQTSIKDFKIIPDIDHSVLKLTVFSEGDSTNCNFTAQVKDGNNVIQTMTGKPGQEILIPVPNAKLWSPDSPFLYDLNITLTKNDKAADRVSSYFGMRKISVEDVNGVKKLFLNNKFLFELGPLDQGFWPDGIYTAPTDAALRFDIESMKKMGFNMVRKHIKVESYRWYYWADKLGLMVWQDMPSMNSYLNSPVPPPLEKEAYKRELSRLVESHWNTPSIIMWVIFNESQGQHDQKELCEMVKKADPSRLVNQASGGGYSESGDVLDVHSYPPPSIMLSKTQAMANGEYGGIGYKIPGHLWNGGFGYVMIDKDDDYRNLYDSFINMLTAFKTNSGLSAAVYTEITDVEIEVNGLLTYDRIPKTDFDKIKASNQKVINKELYSNVVLPTSLAKARTWKYSTDNTNTEWAATKFDDSKWQTGEAGFGATTASAKTAWATADIWMRQEFTLGNISKINKDDLILNIQSNGNCEIFINGVKAADAKSSRSYSMATLSKEAKAALVSNGKNIIAIHCKQRLNRQNGFIDAGLSLMTFDKPLPSSTVKKLLQK